MSGLRNKLNDYENITDLNLHYEFDDEFVLEFSFEKNSFPHMIGLHKLIDIPLLKKFSEKKVSANYVLSKIMNGKLTEDKIKTSKYFYKIQNRYNKFSSENLFCLTYTNVIIDFDITKLEKSKLKKTKFILFEQDHNKGYRHLCIAFNKITGFYPETFFYEKSDYYLKNQIIKKIKKVLITRKDGTIYFEDSFE